MVKEMNGTVVIAAKHRKIKYFFLYFAMVAILAAVALMTQVFIQSGKKEKSKEADPRKMEVTLWADAILALGAGVVAGIIACRNKQDVQAVVGKEDVEITVGSTKQSYPITSFVGIKRSIVTGKGPGSAYAAFYFETDPEDSSDSDTIYIQQPPDREVLKISNILSKRRYELLGEPEAEPFEGEEYTARPNLEMEQRQKQNRTLFMFFLFAPLSILLVGLLLMLMHRIPLLAGIMILILSGIGLIVGISMIFYLRKNLYGSGIFLSSMNVTEDGIRFNDDSYAYSDISSMFMTPPCYSEYNAESRDIRLAFRNGGKEKVYSLMMRRAFDASEADTAVGCSCTYPEMWTKMKEICERKGIPFTEIE